MKYLTDMVAALFQIPAIKYFDKSEQINPTNGRIYYSKSRSMVKKGDIKSALVMGKKATGLGVTEFLLPSGDYS
jgi:hypothetical protein